MARRQIRRGDDWDGVLTFRDHPELNLATVQQIWLTFRWKPAKPGVDVDDSNAIVQITMTGGGITVVDIPNRIANARLTPAQTRLFTKKDDAYYDVQVLTAEGKKKTTEDGTIPILGEVTLS